MIQIVLSLLLSFSAPLFLIPIEKIFPYPHLIEEPVKLLVVCLANKNSRFQFKKSLFFVFLLSLSFTLSESLFYLVNFQILGNFLPFFERIFLTLVLHSLTFFLLFLFYNKNKPVFTFTGLILSILLHFFYNLIVAKIVF